MAKINLQKDLTKLAIDERINLMMQYRSKVILLQKAPLTTNEYAALDNSIKTDEEIKAYNKIHHDWEQLMYRVDGLYKIHSNFMLSVGFLMKMITSKEVASGIIDSINYFIFIIRDAVDAKKLQERSIYKSLEKAFKDVYCLDHIIKISQESEDGEIFEYLDLEYSPSEDVYKRTSMAVKYLNKNYIAFIDNAQEYKSKEEEFNLHLTAFNELLNEFEKKMIAKMLLLKELLPEEIKHEIIFD